MSKKTADAADGGSAEPNPASQYAATVREWVAHSPLGDSQGAQTLRVLDEEYQHLTQTPINNFGVLTYNTQLNEVFNICADTMLSAVHRSIYHYHLNNQSVPPPRSNNGGIHQAQTHHHYHVATDEEEIQLASDPLDTSEDDDDSVSSSVEEPNAPPASNAAAGSTGNANGAGGTAQNAAAGQQNGGSQNKSSSLSEAKARKREEAKRRRQEDEQLLLSKRRVRDEKGNLLATIGPFPAPRLTLRSVKPTHPIPSRKLLTQRPQIDFEPSSSSSDVDSLDEEETAAAIAASSSTSASADGSDSSDANTINHLVSFMSPLSMDSLKKVSESAKVKLSVGCSQEDAVSEIVKSAVKLGCEKACVLMDKNKMLDKVASHAHTTRTHILAHLATSIPSFLNSLPADLLKQVGPALGIPNDNASVSELWERIVAMGLCSVLTHLRPRPLKKIAQELNVQLNDSASTEKHCEKIVFTAFPRERLRVRQSKSSKKAPGVAFSVVSCPNQVQGDMGFIVFNVHNISQMRHDAERHYSPEFEYGNLRWSLLCMSNKDSLALYLCQQGTVHCKFIITVTNQSPEEAVFNEGTQRFSSASAENDWGFNTVIRFESLLDPKNGYWNQANDTITIEVGIVLVESNAKTSAAVIGPGTTAAQKQAQAEGNNTNNNNKASGGAPQGDRKAAQAGGGGGGGKRKDDHRGEAEKDQKRIVESVAHQLLESERLEALRKKIKQDVARVQKDEEKQRKERVQQQTKAWQQIHDSGVSERKRIAQEQHDRERREAQERAREQDRIRQFQEQNAELRRRIDTLTEEQADLDQKRGALSAEGRELKKSLEAAKGELPKLDTQLHSVQRLHDERAKVHKEKAARIEALKKEIAAIPPPPKPPTPLVQPSAPPQKQRQQAQKRASAAASATGGASDPTGGYDRSELASRDEALLRNGGGHHPTQQTPMGLASSDSAGAPPHRALLGGGGPSSDDDSDPLPQAEAEILRSVQESLAAIMDMN